MIARAAGQQTTKPVARRSSTTSGGLARAPSKRNARVSSSAVLPRVSSTAAVRPRVSSSTAVARKSSSAASPAKTLPERKRRNSLGQRSSGLLPSPRGSEPTDGRAPVGAQPETFKSASPDERRRRKSGASNTAAGNMSRPRIQPPLRRGGDREHDGGGDGKPPGAKPRTGKSNTHKSGVRKSRRSPSPVITPGTEPEAVPRCAEDQGSTEVLASGILPSIASPSMAVSTASQAATDSPRKGSGIVRKAVRGGAAKKSARRPHAEDGGMAPDMIPATPI